MIHSHWIQRDPEGTGWSFLWTQIRLDQIWTENLIVSKLIFFLGISFDPQFILTQRKFGNLKCNWTNNFNYFLGYNLFGLRFFFDPQFFWVNFCLPKHFLTNIFFISKSFVLPNIFLTQHFLGYNFLQKKCGPKHFLTKQQQIFGTHSFLGPTFFGTNIFYDPNLDQQLQPDQIVFWDKTFFNPSSLFDQTKFCTQTEIFWHEMLFGELMENSSVALLSSTCLLFKGSIFTV